MLICLNCLMSVLGILTVCDMAAVLKTSPLSRSLSRGTISLAAMNYGTLKPEVGNSKGDLGIFPFDKNCQVL